MQAHDAPARWRPMVESALTHRARFAELVAMAEPGPLRDQIASIGRRLDDGVDTVWTLVQQGDLAERAVSVTDPAATAERLKEARRRLAAAAHDADGIEELEARVDALARSHAAAQRLCNSVEDLGHQLDVINARLAAAVAQTAELVVGDTNSDALARVTRELDDAVTHLESTRQALAEVDRL